MKKLIIVPILLLAFLLSACGGSEYDDEIDAAIAADNKYLDEEPGIQKDIDGISRESVGIEVYDDGEIIGLTYEIRQGNVITHHWQQNGDTWEYKGESVVEGKEPVYTENMDE